MPVAAPSEPRPNRWGTVQEGRGVQLRREPVRSRRVVGREAETATLHEALQRATAGQGGVVLLVGEPGIGKSRLTQSLATTAQERQLAVLRGRAVASPTPLPYRPLSEALCSAVRDGDFTDEVELQPFRSLLGCLVPEWHSGGAHVGAPVLALAEAVLRFLRTVADRRGCVAVFEDLHWADPETLRIIEYLADNLAAERVLCLVTLRDEEPTDGLELARTLYARRAAPLIELDRLDDLQVAEMVRSCLGAVSVPASVLDLVERGDGVPFLVEELLDEAVTRGALVLDGDGWRTSGAVEPSVPLSFADSMRRRVAELDDPSRTVLYAAAVLGRGFDWRLLPAITGLRQEVVLGALRRAVDARIVEIERGEPRYRFRHALSRDAVVAELLPQELVGSSRRALEAVAAAHPELEDGWCELASELAERGGDRDRAGRLLLEAGRRSLRRGALASAEAALERARGLLEVDDTVRSHVDECLAEVLSLAGKRDRAREVGDALLARLRGDDTARRRRADIEMRLARAALAATHWDEAHELIAQARIETADLTDARLIARLDALQARTAIMREPEHAPYLARSALAAAERLHLPDVACEALEVLGRSERPRDLAVAETAFARALAVAEEHGLTLARAQALHELGTIDMLRGGDVRRLEEARDLAVVQGALATAAVVDVQIAAALVLRDDPEPAVAAIDRTRELARRYGLDQTLAAAVALEAHVHARAGRPDAMQRCVEEARSHATDVPDVEVKISFASAVAAFIEEDRSSALGHLHDAVHPATAGPGGDYSASPGAGVLALVTAVEADPDDPLTPARTTEPVHFVAAAFLRYARAVAAGRAGEPDHAVDLTFEGDQLLGDHLWLRQLGHRLVAEAALVDGWGRPVPWLREALALFDSRGEDRMASACRSLLRTAGVPVPRRRGEAVPGPLRALGLTSREHEVLRLLALGLANREIGTRLYISPRTVERHIANLAVKIGIDRRTELVAFAARTLSDLPPPQPQRPLR